MKNYVVNGEILHLISQLIDIYNKPCVVDDGGIIQRVDYTNKIYGLLGQLYQEMNYHVVEELKS